MSDQTQLWSDINHIWAANVQCPTIIFASVLAIWFHGGQILPELVFHISNHKYVKIILNNLFKHAWL